MPGLRVFSIPSAYVSTFAFITTSRVLLGLHRSMASFFPRITNLRNLSKAADAWIQWETEDLQVQWVSQSIHDGGTIIGKISVIT